MFPWGLAYDRGLGGGGTGATVGFFLIISGETGPPRVSSACPVSESGE